VTLPTGTFTFEKGKHRLHPPFHTLVTSVAALAMAATLVSDGRTAFKKNIFGRSGFQQGEVAVAESQQFDIEVAFPLCGPIEALIMDQIADAIELTFRTKTSAQNQPSYRHHTDGYIEGLLNYITPLFVEFYEDNKLWLEANIGPMTSWPSIWNFGWLVRNSIAHSGKIYFRNQNANPVIWYHIIYGPADNGLQIVGNVLSFADILILMCEMSDELDRLGCPI
jgi:hypothetical protein